MSERIGYASSVIAGAGSAEAWQKWQDEMTGSLCSISLVLLLMTAAAVFVLRAITKWFR
jgi:hypothetical protein